MTRFILVSFAFMGWGLYELSGGADFEPGPNTLTVFAPMPADIQMAKAEPASETVARADISGTVLTQIEKPDALPDIELASIDRVGEPAVDPVVDAEKLAALIASGMSETDTAASGSEAVARSENALEAQDGSELQDAVLYSMADLDSSSPRTGASDLREVAGTRVNMRDGPGTSFAVVSQLSRGDQVIVLQNTGDGWLKLQVVETSRVGWMADFLVTAAAN